MPTFSLTIDYGNAAMSDTAHLQTALERVARGLGNDHVCDIADMPAGYVRDENGNTVGKYGITSRPDVAAFTYRNLAACVFDSFAISTREIADSFGVSLAKVRDALSAYPSVFCGDLEETAGGVTDRRSGARSHADGGQYGAIVWQCFKTYDDHQQAEVLADLETAGADLDAII